MDRKRPFFTSKNGNNETFISCGILLLLTCLSKHSYYPTQQNRSSRNPEQPDLTNVVKLYKMEGTIIPFS